MCYGNMEEGEVGVTLVGGTGTPLGLGTGRHYSLLSNSLVTNIHCVSKEITKNYRAIKKTR